MSDELSEPRRKLNVLPESVCACETCVRMCETNPCVPNPEEAVKIMEAHGREALSLRPEYDDYADDDEDQINVLVMARCDGNAGGYEDGRYRSYRFDAIMDKPERRCVMLEEDGRCKLHDSGFKPEGARRVRHLTPEERADVFGSMFKQLDSVHDLMIELWDVEGKEVVELWKRDLNRL